MNNQIDSVDFINSVNKILQEFVTTYLDWHVAFDYDDVQKIYSLNIENKPTVHFEINRSFVDNAKTIVKDDGTKGERIIMFYSVFVVVDNDYRAGVKRIELLNELSSQLKNIFDNHSSDLDMFNRIKMNYSEGRIGENPDNLHASHQRLTFSVIKEL